MTRSVRPLLCWTLASGVSAFSLLAAGQVERHGRGYKPLPPTAPVVVTVEKGFNSKPLPNVSVIFRSTRDDRLTANLETKTDPDGRASLDLLEVGSHVTVQVIANGFSTYASEFDLGSDGKQMLVKLQRPRAQVSQYEENTDRAAAVQPGVQEHRAPATSHPPVAASPKTPLQTTPPANTPANTVPTGAQPGAKAGAQPGAPQ